MSVKKTAFTDYRFDAAKLHFLSQTTKFLTGNIHYKDKLWNSNVKIDAKQR